MLLICRSTLQADPPVAVDDASQTVVNSPVTIPVLANDWDAESNQLAILRVTQPLHGRVAINPGGAVPDPALTHLFGFAAVQLSNTVVQVGNTNLYPWVTASNGTWNASPAGDNNWVSGFFPGALWLIYEHTGDTNYRVWAESWMAGIAPLQFSTNVDDVGFMINTSFGNGYRIVGDPNYKVVLLRAAQSLSMRFNPVVGCLADDRLLVPPPFEVILDTMMNSELLYRAHDLDGDTNLLSMAASHAEKTMLNHLRPDGSTYHMVLYNATNGVVLYRGNRAIDPPLDTWARGHAWATYGFTMAFRETGDTRFLDTAKRVADFYINSVPPDYVPYWYFQSNGIPPAPPLRDSSAAAITLSALLELSQLATNSSDGAKYWLAARHIFNSLSSTNYLAQGTASSGILLHGNSVDAQTDASLIYGDYYFIEALKRYEGIYNQTTVTYVPNTNFCGTDSFAYQVCDSGGNSATATVTVVVSPAATNIFAVQISLAPDTHLPVISFPTVTGLSYDVQYRDGLAAGLWSLLATNLASSGAARAITDSNPATATRFYRVSAHLPYTND